MYKNPGVVLVVHLGTDLFVLLLFLFFILFLLFFFFFILRLDRNGKRIGIFLGPRNRSGSMRARQTTGHAAAVLVYPKHKTNPPPPYKIAKEVEVLFSFDVDNHVGNTREMEITYVVHKDVKNPSQGDGHGFCPAVFWAPFLFDFFFPLRRKISTR